MMKYPKEVEYLLKTGDPVHLYPDTSILMIPGDVLYSSKTAFSSFLVGHTGIVGGDFRIYHVNRWGKKGHADSMPIYLSRHKKGEKLTILRFANHRIAKEAAKWAKHNIDHVETYKYTRDLANIQMNYCSKFIWQAFYFGAHLNVDLLGGSLNERNRRFIMPGQILRRLDIVGNFLVSAMTKKETNVNRSPILSLIML